MIAIGIDTGVHTGFAVWHSTEKRFLNICEHKIHRAFDGVDEWFDLHPDLVVVFEDARLRTWFANADQRGAAAREGVGSVKRDASIWEDFLDDRGYPYVARKPMSGATKWKASQFAVVTGWKGQTNEHGRDAAMLVYDMHPSNLKSIRLEWQRAHAKAPTGT